jgi:phosphoesterase RecJ-like protein
MTADAMSEAAAALEAADSVVAMGHVGPDGDALGAMIAVSLGAADAGKRSVATFSEPFTIADRYRYLDTSTLVAPDEIGEVFDVAVVCDCASEDRLGTAARHAASSRTLVVIDHHVSTDESFGDIRVIDATAAATTQLVYGLLQELRWPVTRPIADALYTGLVTDTGRFQYSNTSPDVHRIAAELLDRGVQTDVIGQHVYEEAPFGYLQVVSAVTGRARLDAEARLVWSWLEQADLDAAGLSYEEAEGLIDLIRVADRADVACLLRDLDESTVKGSLRSRGRVDVAAIAEALGGGGHHNAAGFTTDMDVDDVVAFVRSRL